MASIEAIALTGLFSAFTILWFSTKIDEKGARQPLFFTLGMFILAGTFYFTRRALEISGDTSFPAIDNVFLTLAFSIIAIWFWSVGVGLFFYLRERITRRNINQTVEQMKGVKGKLA